MSYFILFCLCADTISVIQVDIGNLGVIDGEVISVVDGMLAPGQGNALYNQLNGKVDQSQLDVIDPEVRSVISQLLQPSASNSDLLNVLNTKLTISPTCQCFNPAQLQVDLLQGSVWENGREKNENLCMEEEMVWGRGGGNHHCGLHG